MKSSEPPAGAKWILEHIQFGHANDALMGDLEEAFKTQERSQWWYWRQALIAILVAFSNELRRHWLMACRAAAFGLIVSYGAQMLGHEALINLHHSLTSVIGVHAFSALAWILNAFFCGLVSGWTVALLHRKYKDTMLFAFLGALLIWETIVRFYVSPFDIDKGLPFAFVFYLFAPLGVFVGGFLFTSRPPIDPRIRRQHFPIS
ncbi:MAG TPA: hypothetical protein VGL97_12230 [Bryobacteraceae bacterium]|jgi:hypothetical protein